VHSVLSPNLKVVRENEYWLSPIMSWTKNNPAKRELTNGEISFSTSSR